MCINVPARICAGVRQANSGVDSRCKSGGKEGVTSHFRREPCACHREVSGEVSVAVRVGRASEHRNRCLPECRDFLRGRRQHWPSVFVRTVGLRGVQEPMHARKSTQGTWEGFASPRQSSRGRGGEGEI